MRALLGLLAGISLTIAAHAREQGAPQAGHDHAAAEHFGSVHFETSCSAAVQPQFDLLSRDGKGLSGDRRSGAVVRHGVLGDGDQHAAEPVDGALRAGAAHTRMGRDPESARSCSEDREGARLD